MLRAPTLVLPVDSTFLYVDPIYIQATEARMPQIKKVVLAIGDRLIYRDTFGEALADLTDVRDAALATYDLLVDRIGGPPVRPYQPPGLWRGQNAFLPEYVEDKGEGLYRRSMYTFWRRTSPPPASRWCSRT